MIRLLLSIILVCGISACGDDAEPDASVDMPVAEAGIDAGPQDIPQEAIADAEPVDSANEVSANDSNVGE